MKIYYLLIICIAGVLFSCNLTEDFDKLKDTPWNPDIAISLVNSNLTIEKLIDIEDSSSFLINGSDNLLEIVYTDTVLPINTFELVEIPDVQFPVPDSNLTIQSPFDAISSFNTKTGFIAVDIQNDHPEPISLTYSIPNANINGGILTRNIPLGVNERIQDTVSLEGVQFSMPDETITIRYKAISPSAPSVQLRFFLMEFKDISYSFATGRFEEIEIDLEEGIIGTDLFNNVKSGSFYFEDPQITFTITNSFGFPVKLQANEISASSNTQSSFPLESVLDQGVLLNYPALNNVGGSEQTEITLTSENSNFAEVISQTPNTLFYDLNIIPFPSEVNVPAGFITDNASIDIHVDVSLPLQVRVSDLVLQDTLEVSLDDLEEGSYADVVVITENEFPLDGSLQVFFLNGRFELIDSLFSANEPIFNAAPLNAQNEVEGSSAEQTDFSIEGDKFNAIRNTEHIVLKATFNSQHPTDGTVKLRSDQTVNVKIGIKTGL